MKALAIFGAAALLGQPALGARSTPTLAEDAADVAVRFCFDVTRGSLRWNPAKLDEEQALLARYGLKPGIPGGLLDSLGPTAASSFNQSVLGSRANGPNHVLLAVGGRMPGCRVTVAGAPGVVAVADFAQALEGHGWTAAPALFRASGPIERHSFLRRTDDGSAMMLDLLFVKEPSGTFRAMLMVMRPPAALKLPDGF